jgi:tetratricopeptide (TPR) repeat protein
MAIKKKRYRMFLLLLMLNFFTAGPLLAQEDPQGRIISFQGRVEHLRALLERWNPAILLQELFVRDRVKTYKNSRAAVLFIDETQVRMREEAELTVRTVQKEREQATVFELVKGEGWFRTKSSTADLEVATPAATAAIRGTEVDIRVEETGETVLIVLEGDVTFGNEAGSILVFAGEEATALPGKAPTKRAVLNPQDAVQWVLYYPTTPSWHDYLRMEMPDSVREGFRLLKEGNTAGALAVLEPLLEQDGWARLGASLAYLEAGDPEAARSVLETGIPLALQAEKLAQLAAIEMSVGNVEAARGSLEAALREDPRNLRALVLSSTVELIQNKKERARLLAQEALESHPGSVAANIATGESAQAYFDLRTALYHYERALSLDPDDLRALVDRARVLFGSGRNSEAKKDAEKALALYPQDAQALSLAGFLRLAEGDLDTAQGYFERATENNPELGEPHLGLSILLFKQKETEEGLWEMLAATLLEPKLALFQSYLGKAYYQLRRFPESLSALETAKLLDPKDPTPWLYTSIILRDLNRLVEALGELDQAIARNDNRAVYRSRLLLDRDQATKNVSLAEVYTKLGFESRGVHEALNSLNADLTNSSAHLLLADLYARLPDRTAAQTSEFLQHLIFAPVNGNVFAGYNEYSTLFEQPRFTPSILLEAGYPLYGEGQAVSRLGGDRYAHFTLLNYEMSEGQRSDEYDRAFLGYTRGKFLATDDTSLVFSLLFDWWDRGASETAIEDIGETTAHPVTIQVPEDNPDPKESNKTNDFEFLLGVKQDFGVASTLIGAFQYTEYTSQSETPDQPPSLFLPFLLNTSYEQAYRAFDLQAEYILRLGERNQLLIGAEGFLSNMEWRNTGILYDPDDPAEPSTTAIIWDDRKNPERWGFSAWLSDSWQIWRWLHCTGGVGYQKAVGEAIVEDLTHDYSWFSPFLGLSVELGEHFVLRAAGFRKLNTRLFETKIFPTTVEGFLLDRNEALFTRRNEAGLSLEARWSWLYLMIQGFYRNITNPEDSWNGLPGADSYGSGVSLNLILGNNFGLSIDDTFAVTDTIAYREMANQLRTGISFYHQAGVIARLINNLYITRYSNTDIEELNSSIFDLVDIEINYELPNKLGTLQLSATNILDRDFRQFTELMILNRIFPYRWISANFRLSL